MRPDWIPFGFLPVFKPQGPTSHDVVVLVRRQLPKTVKVGHTGTLDPFASGVLILALGKATKFADDIHLMDKSYDATLRLGMETDTLDLTGSQETESPIPPITDQALADCARKFTGEQAQVPPAYSAKRVRGKKSYQLARQKRPVDLPPSQVSIFELTLTPRGESDIHMNLTCSTGTYVRALGRDIARHLGTLGHLIQLERTKVGPITSDQCLSIEDLTSETIGNCLIPVSRILKDLPEIVLPDEAFQPLRSGQVFPTREVLPPRFLGVVHGPEGKVRAIFRCEFQSQKSCVVSRLLCYESGF